MFCPALFLALVAFTSASILPTNVTLVENAPRKIGKRCVGTIQSLNDVAAAEQCTTITIGGFTVPAGKTFALAPPDGAKVTLTG
jgi:polygalacturonase